MIDEVQLTAYALGELGGEALLAVERAVAQDAALAAEVAEIRATASLLERELRAHPGLDERAERAPSWPAAALQPERGPTRAANDLAPRERERAPVPDNLASRSVPPTGRALEMKVIWGDTVLDLRSATLEPAIMLEQGPADSAPEKRRPGTGSSISLPPSGLPGARYLLAEAVPGEPGTQYRVQLHPAMAGRLDRPDGTSTPLAELIRRGQPSRTVPGAVEYRLEAEQVLTLVLGAFRIQLRYVRKASLAPSALAERTQGNLAWANALVIAMVLHVVAVGGLVAAPGKSEDPFAELTRNPRFVAVHLAKRGPGPKSDLLAKLQAGRRDEGRPAPGKGAVPAPRPVPAPPAANARAIAEASLERLLATGGRTGASASSSGRPRDRRLFGDGGLGGGLAGALSSVEGTRFSDASGLGGLGTRGSGPGSGGLSSVGTGLGALGTNGRGGGGGGGAGYGGGAGDLGPKKERAVEVSGEVRVSGSIDRELILQVIEEHRAQIRYCYESSLVKTPGLMGKVALSWTIGPAGQVLSAKVRESVLNEPSLELERCLTGRVIGWTFPRPRGGGSVIVNYPFVFQIGG
jgi:hypothetical protein